MDYKIGLADKNEYSISVENVFVNLLVNKTKLQPIAHESSLVSHTHMFSELFFCLNGIIDIKTPTGVIQLSKGDIAIAPANLSHHIISAGGPDDWYAIGFFITKKSGNKLFDLYKKLRPLYECTEIHVFHNLLELCQTAAELCKPIYEANSYLPALEFVGILSKLAILKPLTELPTSKEQTYMPDIYRMSWFEDLIANRYYEPLTTSLVAEMLHISPRHLSRIIKNRYGKTFHQVLSEKRLNFAANILLTTNRSANSIASEVGYAKNSSFYKDFLSYFGVTPAEYRKCYSENTQ